SLQVTVAVLIALVLYLIHINRNCLMKPTDLDKRPKLLPRDTIETFTDEDVTLDDIYITIKTGSQFHLSRITYIMNTWFDLVKDQAYIFTDWSDKDLNLTANGHLVNTQCGAGKGYEQLGCKMGTEFDAFVDSGKKWWCRFDDDNYVIPARLLHLVRSYNSSSDVYIGRLTASFFHCIYHGKYYRYQFAHGGAGCCITRPLALKMRPWCGRTKLVKTQMETQMNDDCALGFIITALLKVDITLSDLLHSHYEDLSLLNPNTFTEQVALAWGRDNVVDLKHLKTPAKIFDIQQDPSRFYTLHCMVYPSADFCK
uniref:Fringe-like glycosyltransferase domain-containing protein n=1 Tax=Ciona savignyi TaxID=51511 RepID=H2YCT2_CIOSA